MEAYGYSATSCMEMKGKLYILNIVASLLAILAVNGAEATLGKWKPAKNLDKNGVTVQNILDKQFWEYNQKVKHLRHLKGQDWVSELKIIFDRKLEAEKGVEKKKSIQGVLDILNNYLSSKNKSRKMNPERETEKKEKERAGMGTRSKIEKSATKLRDTLTIPPKKD